MNVEGPCRIITRGNCVVKIPDRVIGIAAAYFSRLVAENIFNPLVGLKTISNPLILMNIKSVNIYETFYLLLDYVESDRHIVYVYINCTLYVMSSLRDIFFFYSEIYYFN